MAKTGASQIKTRVESPSCNTGITPIVPSWEKCIDHAMKPIFELAFVTSAAGLSGFPAVTIAWTGISSSGTEAAPTTVLSFESNPAYKKASGVLAYLSAGASNTPGARRLFNDFLWPTLLKRLTTGVSHVVSATADCTQKHCAPVCTPMANILSSLNCFTSQAAATKEGYTALADGDDTSLQAPAGGAGKAERSSSGSDALVSAPWGAKALSAPSNLAQAPQQQTMGLPGLSSSR